MMFGNKSFVAQLVLPAMLKLCERPTAPKEACAALAKWDGKMENDSRSAILFELFWVRVMSNQAIWGVPFDKSDIVNTPRDLKIDGVNGDLLLAALVSAAEMMKGFGVALDTSVGEVRYAERGAARIPILGQRHWRHAQLHRRPCRARAASG